MSVNIEDALKVDSNQKRWNALKQKLNVTDDVLVNTLLDNYDKVQDVSGTSSPSVDHCNFSHLLSALDNQRSHGSMFCDLLIKFNTNSGESSSSQKEMHVHKGFLCALLGEPFIAQLDQIQAMPLMKNDVSPKSKVAKGMVLGTESVLTLPLGFEYVVEYCYKGVFSLPEVVDEKQIRDVIGSMVENGIFKQKMLSQLADCIQKRNVLSSEPSSSDSNTQPHLTVACDLNASDESHSGMLFDKNEILENSRRRRKSKQADEDFLWSDGSTSNKEDENDETFIPNELSNASSHEEDLSDAAESDADDVAAVDPMTKGCMCVECDRFFVSKEKLEEHFKDHEAIKQRAALLPPKRPRGRPKGSKNKPVTLPSTDLPKRRRKPRFDFSDEIGTTSKTYSATKKFKKVVGECCGEIFFKKLSFGVHVFENHSDILVQCAICAAFIKLESQLAHYQTIHNCGPFPENNQQVLQKYINNFTGHENVAESDDPSLQPNPAVMHESAMENKTDNFGSQFNSEGVIGMNNESRVQISLDMDGISGDLNVSGGASSTWHSETVCVDCRQKMTIFKYVEHLQTQCARAKASICGFSNSSNYKCLYMVCKLCPTFEKSIHLYTFFRTHMDRFHIKNALGDTRVNCPECDRTVLKYYLKKHLENHAKGPEKLSQENRSVACDVCGKTVKRRRLKIHRRTHFEQYPCQYCSKVFNRRENLHVHIRIHTGEKPFVCDICGKGFRQYIELRLHNRRHRKEELIENEANDAAIMLVPPTTTGMESEEPSQFQTLIATAPNQNFQYKLH